MPALLRRGSFRDFLFFVASSLSAAVIAHIEALPLRRRGFPNADILLMAGVALGLLASLLGSIVYAYAERRRRRSALPSSRPGPLILPLLLGASYPLLLRAGIAGIQYFESPLLPAGIWIPIFVVLATLALSPISALVHQPPAAAFRQLSLHTRLALSSAITASQSLALWYVGPLPIGEHQIRDELVGLLSFVVGPPLAVIAARKFGVAPSLSPVIIAAAALLGLAAAIGVKEALVVERSMGDIMWYVFPYGRVMECVLVLACSFSAVFLGTFWVRRRSSRNGPTPLEGHGRSLP